MCALDVVAADGVRLDALLHHAAGEPLGVVILAHGITVDKDEGGMFVRLADRLVERGFTVLRFSFRGHGSSGGGQRGVTIAGELLDLQAAVEYTRREVAAPVSIVAASFGAVPAALSLPYLRNQLRELVLWNPVLDLRHTFLEPKLPWGLENYGPEQQKRLRSDGFLLVDGEFELGRVLFDEFALYDPQQSFLASDVPALVVHGDADTYVSYPIARDAAAAHQDARLHTISGSDHGFDSREREDEAIDATVEWLATRRGDAG